MVTRGTSKNECNKIMILATYYFSKTMKAYIFRKKNTACYILKALYRDTNIYIGCAQVQRGEDLLVCFVALRPKSTAMVIAGRSVHLTTLFPGQA